VSIFADRWCHVVSVTDPYGRSVGFIEISANFFFYIFLVKDLTPNKPTGLYKDSFSFTYRYSFKHLLPIILAKDFKINAAIVHIRNLISSKLSTQSTTTSHSLDISRLFIQNSTDTALLGFMRQNLERGTQGKRELNENSFLLPQGDVSYCDMPSSLPRVVCCLSQARDVITQQLTSIS
jgi:hypothetical protein